MTIRSGPAAEEVQDLFSSIAGSYDLANDLITFGIARRWRRSLVDWSLEGLPPVTRVLDCATGTGDLVFEFSRALSRRSRPADLDRARAIEITGCDFCEPMLNIASEKANRMQRSSLPKIKFEVADATALPYSTDTFDVCSIAYGIRNVQDVPLALSEMARVTRPGGHVMILETGVAENRALRLFVDLHFKKIVPALGGLVSGRRAAYDYLQKTSRAFPSGSEFCDVLMLTGHFSSVEYRPFLGGASFVYRAIVN